VRAWEGLETSGRAIDVADVSLGQSCVVPARRHGGYQKCHQPVHDHCPSGRPHMFHDLQEHLP